MAQARGAGELVFLDNKGVIRWTKSKQEANFFGANYCLPSACDYRAARYVTNDLKNVIDIDIAHFARMGWDALRLGFWGDYENTDTLGNLVSNDHLDLTDYLIFKAKQRGIYFLLSPIITYSSQWPDAMSDTISAKGFSTHFKKSEFGTNPRAIAAQQNYLKQLLNHVNPYTGIALKDEPSILFIEMINEPWHHSEDVEGSVNYINALVDAVRSTGCKKILFHNYSQDFNMAVPIAKSKVQGLTFAWYPSGLNSGKTLRENFLPVVDHYSEQVLRPELSTKAKIVYEFDSPDLLTGYMYPAMARSFREVGAQFASMFAYDMMATAPYNLGWQTHCLNMVYTPKKAVSAIIAAEVMKQIPRFKNYGNYPANTSFGPFRVSHDEDLGEMNTPERYYYANNTSTTPADINKLRKVVGYGSSHVVQYHGTGIYFLDKIQDGVWRLEVYPDVAEVNDPFNMPAPDKVVFRALYKAWPMRVALPGLASNFSVLPIDSGNSYNTIAVDKKFTIQPGVYILASDETFNRKLLADTLGNIGMAEFHVPQAQQLPAQVDLNHQPSYYAGNAIRISANVYARHIPSGVTLYLKAGNRYWPIPMQRDSGYRYVAEVPASRANEGWIDYCIVVNDGNKTINYPSGIAKSPADWSYNDAGTWRSVIVKEKTPLRLLQPLEDSKNIAFTRIGDGIRFGIYKLIPSSQTGEPTIHLELPLSYDKDLRDYTLSVPVREKIAARQKDIAEAKGLMIEARGVNQKQQAYITLVEKDGTSWSKKILLDPQWKTMEIPLSQLELSKGAMLPVGYPGEWKYWFEPAAGRGGKGDTVRMENVERVQLSVRPNEAMTGEATAASWLDISSVYVTF